jgi:hypothetical protein
MILRTNSTPDESRKSAVDQTVTAIAVEDAILLLLKVPEIEVLTLQMEQWRGWIVTVESVQQNSQEKAQKRDAHNLFYGEMLRYFYLAECCHGCWHVALRLRDVKALS